MCFGLDFVVIDKNLGILGILKSADFCAIFVIYFVLVLRENMSGY